MIFGIGTDIVEVERIKEAFARHGDRFAKRLLSPAELDQFADRADPIPFLAKRWAAKEAFAKALGTAVRPPVSLAGITVTHDEMGRPGLSFDDQIVAYMHARSITNAHLSLSDERLSALAFVVLECNSPAQV